MNDDLIPTVPDLTPLSLEAILSLPAAKNRIFGREIDIEIARRIFGCDAPDDVRFTGKNRWGQWGRGWICRSEWGTFHNLNNYSTDVGDAMLIVNSIEAAFSLHRLPEGWRATFDAYTATAPKPALAICRAALVWAYWGRELATAPIEG